MSELRVNFLNWRPDQDPLVNDGLTRAENVVHDVDGYKPIYLGTTVSQTGGLASVGSIVTKAIGPLTDTFSAWISGATLHVGINGVTATSSTTGYPQSNATVTAQRFISAFDVTEMDGYICFVAEATFVHITPSTTTYVRTTGYMTL